MPTGRKNSDEKIILIISAALLAAGIIGCVILAVPVAVKGEQYMNDKMESKMETTTFVFDKTMRTDSKITLRK